MSIPDWAVRVFGTSEIALFDGDEQITEWQPYDLQTNTYVTAPRRVVRPVLALRGHDPALLGDVVIRTSGRTIVEPGEHVQLGHPSTWTVTAR